MSLRKGLVGHYKFDDKSVNLSNDLIRDSSAYDRHGSIEDVDFTVVDGRVNDAGDFTGDGGIRIQEKILNINEDFTISAWIYDREVADSSDNDYLDVVNIGGNQVIFGNLGDPASFRFYMNQDSGSSVAATYNTEEWTHVAATFDSDALEGELFIDGESAGKFTISSLITYNGDTTIGMNTNNTDHWDGKIDDVRFYQRRLPQEEIQQLYQVRSDRTQRMNLQKGLVGHWKLETTDWNDSSALDRHGTAVNNPQITSGIVGNAASFNSSSSQRIKTVVDDRDVFSVFVWFKGELGDQTEAFPRLVSSTESAGPFSNSNGFNIAFRTNNPKIIFNVGDGTSEGAFTQKTNVSLDGQWHHTGFSFDGDVLTYYVDGEKIAAKDRSIDGRDLISGVGEGGKITIGGIQKSPNASFDGDIDEVRYYDRVITEEEVQQLYQTQSERTHKMDLNRKLVAHYTFDDADTSGSTLKDSSARGNHATINGNVSSGASGQVGEAYHFPSTSNSDYVSIAADSIKLEAPFTITTWIQANQIASEDNSIYPGIYNGKDGGGQSGAFDDYLSMNRVDKVNKAVTSGSVDIDFRFEGANGSGTGVGQYNYTIGDWIHLAFKIDSNNDAVVYIDGEKIDSSSVAGTIEIEPSYLGAGYGGATSHVLDGKLDDFRLYDRELSQSEIQQIFQQRTEHVNNV